MGIFSQTRIVSCKDLYAKDLIIDIKEAAVCDVRTVCRLACHHCPYVLENIDAEQINIKGLHAYTIKLEKAENGQLLLSITAPDIENWLRENSLPYTRPKVRNQVGIINKASHMLIDYFKKIIRKSP